MSQGTAKPHTLEEADERPVRVEGEEGKEELRTRSGRQLALLESIDENLKKLVFLIESKL